MIYENSYTRLTLALDIVCKINLGEFAGFHELGIIKHQINLFDSIGLEKSNRMKISCSNPRIPLDNRNICWTVADIFRDHYGISDAVHIDIDKNIPVQGGLAGGSTNAATVIMLLAKIFDIKFDLDEFMKIGQKSGMDVPFYFLGNTAFDTESTGVLESIKTDLKFTFILVMPPFGVSTKAAYGEIDYSKIALNMDMTELQIRALTLGDRTSVIENMHNDFEYPVFLSRPKLIEIREEMLEAGCQNVILSGSGSTMIGVVESREDGERIASELSYKCQIVESL